MAIKKTGSVRPALPTARRWVLSAVLAMLSAAGAAAQDWRDQVEQWNGTRRVEHGQKSQPPETAGREGRTPDAVPRGAGKAGQAPTAWLQRTMPVVAAPSVTAPPSPSALSVAPGMPTQDFVPRLDFTASGLIPSGFEESTLPESPAPVPAPAPRRVAESTSAKATHSEPAPKEASPASAAAERAAVERVQMVVMPANPAPTERADDHGAAWIQAASTFTGALLTPLVLLGGFALLVRRLKGHVGPLIRIEHVGGQQQTIPLAELAGLLQGARLQLTPTAATALTTMGDPELAPPVPPEPIGTAEPFELGPSFEEERLMREQQGEHAHQGLLRQLFEDNVKLREQLVDAPPPTFAEVEPAPENANATTTDYRFDADATEPTEPPLAFGSGSIGLGIPSDQ